MKAFGQVRWNTEGEEFPPEHPSFHLRRTAEGRVVVKNITTDVSVEVDSRSLEPGDEWELKDCDIVSIYGWKDFKKTELTYLYGLDPESLELVRHGPGWHGASVSAKDVTKTFTRADGDVVGVSSVSFKIAPSTFVGVYGASGIGKSVLINSLVAPDGGGLDSGEMLVDGAPGAGNPSIAYLPQHLSFPPVLKVKEIIRQGRVRSGCNYERKKRILKLCHVESSWDDLRFKALSGGQQRRLALAMALLDERVRLIVADEPTTGFDIGTEREVMRGLRRLVRLENVTVVVVTHSAFALPIFDKVLVLSKTARNSGAGLCVDSQWLPEYFPEELRRIPQDADRLIALYEGRVSPLLAVRNKFQSPYYHMPPAKRGVVRKLHSFGRQCLSWTSNCCKMALRQKTFACFVIFSIVCVLMIQQGTCCSRRSNHVFLSFMVLCAPWLCATYTAMFCSEILNWFSWEKLSGGSSRSFCVGILGGLMVPYMCISLVFTAGLFFVPNMERVVSEAYDALSRVKAETCISRCFKTDVKRDYDAEIHDGDWKKRQPFWADPPQVRVGNSELGCADSQGKCYRRDFAAVCRKETDASSSGEPWRLAVNQWVLMTLICLVGGTIGLALIACFRDAKTAVLLIVILFIGFIMLSRVCVEPDGCMWSWKYSVADKLDAVREARWVPLIYLSYFGIGRYAYNVLVYPLWGAYLYDWLPLLGWTVLSLSIALRRFADPMQNWRAFDR